MNNVNAINQANFGTEVLQANLPVVVDFYAEWCGPCKALAPLLEQLAGAFEGRMNFVKVNVDNTPQLAARYQVTGVPTLVLFRGGQQVDALVGLVSPKALKSWLEAAAAQPSTVASV